MCKAEEYVTTLISTLTKIIETYEFNNQNITDCEDSLCDLEHEIELSKFDCKRGYKLIKEYKCVRLERRTYKDENETLQFLYDYFSSQKTIIADLKKN